MGGDGFVMDVIWFNVGVNKEGIDAKKMEDFSKWYTQVG